jgi:hypothetical protein
MNLTKNRNRVAKDAGISFPLLECWNPMTRDATIIAQVDGRRVMCRINEKLLKKRFDAPEDRPMSTVVGNRPTLEAAARKLIEAECFEDDGSITIRERDL